MALKGKGKGKGKAIAGKAPVEDLGPSSSSGKRKKSAFASTSAAERCKRRRSGVLKFVDDAAFEAGSESEEEDDEDLDFEVEEPDLGFSVGGTSDIKAFKEVGKSHDLPFLIKQEQFGDDELEELIKDRYAHNSEYVTYSEDAKEFDSKVLGADPTKDAIIWRVKCMVGRERQVAFCFMQKYVDLSNLGTNLQICSVFALEQVKGYVFVEAEKQSDVIEACRGFCSVYPSGIKLVPSVEVPLLLSSRNKALEVPVGSWVRVRSGNYKGDLAQVVAVDDGRKKVTVKLVPRVDLQAIAQKFGGGISLKLSSVPAPRLISSYELEKFRPHIEVRRDRMTGENYEILDGMMLKDGYLFKRVSSGSLIYSGVQPSADEILKFSDSSKADDEDLNWISTVYRGSKKTRFAETSEGAAKKNGFKLHELVFFGRKDFGVIIADEKDYFKILKGDVEAAEVVPVKIQDIKNSCVDKMFTALDHHRKNILINDAVKVLEGPLEGREGIVKHMYKGILFVRDDNELENGGFFCVKSNSCEKVVKFKKNFGENMGNDNFSSFSQSATQTDKQEDGAYGSNWRRQSYGDQPFHVGQTLRIRQGPLKGYLCRVVGIYRSDITVKLDSLVKIITVQDKFLSDPNVKRDHSALSSRSLGTEEKLFSGGFAFGETGSQADKSAWDDGVSSLDRDSWQPFTTSNISSANNTETQTAQGHEDDPWGTKLTLATRTDTGSSDKLVGGWGGSVSSADRGSEGDPWGSKLASAARCDAGVSDKATDSWGGTIANGGPEVDPWGTKITSADRVNTGTSNKALDGWHKAGFTTASSTKDTDGWGKPTGGKAIGGEAETSKIAADGWNTKASVNHDTDINHWGRSNIPSGDTGGSWDTNVNNKNHKDASESAADMPWSSVKNSGGSGGWDTTGSNKEKEQGVSWGQTGTSWDDKGKKLVTSENDAWGRPAVNIESQPSSWDKGTGSSAQSDGWGKAGLKGDAESSGWNKGSFTPSQNDEWVKPKFSDSTHESGWNKSEQFAVNDQDSWSRPRSFEGSGGRGKERGRGFGWGKQSERNNEDDGGRDQESNWGRHRSFDGDGGGRRGRGRVGRFGRGGRGQEDNWSGPRDQENSWVSGGGNSGRGRAVEEAQNTWGSASTAARAETGVFDKAREGWNKSAGFSQGSSDKGTDDWSKSPADKADDWSSGWDTAGSNKDKEQGASWGQTSASTHPKVDKSCSWDDKGKKVVNTEENAWGRPATDIDSQPSGWDTEKGGTAQSDGWSSGWDTARSDKNKEQGASWGQTGASLHAKDDKSCSWDDKGKKVDNTEEGAWGRPATNPESHPIGQDTEKGSSAQSDGWNSGWGAAGLNKDKKQGDSWAQQGASTHSKDDKSCSWDDKGKKVVNTEEGSWGRPAANPESRPIGWETEKGSAQSAGWNSGWATAGSNKDKEQGDNWGQGSVSTHSKDDKSCSWDDKGNKVFNTKEDAWGRAATNIESQSSGWDAKKCSGAHSYGWGKGGWKGEAESSGWSKGSFASGQNDEWTKSEQFAGNGQDGWSRPRNFEGSRGRGRGRERGFGWGRESDQNNEDDGGRESNWGRNRSFDDGGGRRGRGRGGRFGRGGRGQADNWTGPRHQEGGWVSERAGRGRGRGPNGEAASEWSQGSSRNQSLDWKNHEDRSGPSGGSQSSVWNSSQENNQQEHNVTGGSNGSWGKW